VHNRRHLPRWTTSSQSEPDPTRVKSAAGAVATGLEARKAAAS
jgi:hypothetical protein